MKLPGHIVQKREVLFDLETTFWMLVFPKFLIMIEFSNTILKLK